MAYQDLLIVMDLGIADEGPDEGALLPDEGFQRAAEPVRLLFPEAGEHGFTEGDGPEGAFVGRQPFPVEMPCLRFLQEEGADGAAPVFAVQHGALPCRRAKPGGAVPGPCQGGPGQERGPGQ